MKIPKSDVALQNDITVMFKRKLGGISNQVSNQSINQSINQLICRSQFVYVFISLHVTPVFL